MKKPNILYIMTDQQRLSALGCYGKTVCQTPHLDKLAEQGVLFENAYTVCPVCTPARATILTGRYPHIHGMCCNTHNIGCSVHELTDKPELLSRQLEKLDYQIGYTGKWHLGGSMRDGYKTFMEEGKPSLPSDVGFTGMDAPGHGDGGHGTRAYQEYLTRNGYRMELKNKIQTGLIGRHGILEGDEKSTVAYFLAEHSIELMDQFSEEDRPFFITHNFWGPHEPYYVPQKYYDLYKDVSNPPWPNYDWEPEDLFAPCRVKKNPGGQTPWPIWEEAIRHYYALTTLIDEQVGRMLAHLEAKDLLKDTLIFFTSDHGETLGSHGGLTDKGFHHFEETHHVPLLMKLPESSTDLAPTHQGSRVETVVSSIDFYPTILEFAGKNLADDDTPELDGRSLLPLIKGERSSHPNEAFTEFYGVNQLMTTMFTLRKDHLKYGWNCSSRDELYDLEKDPYEMSNLINHPEYQNSLVSLRKRMGALLVESKHQAAGFFKLTVIEGYENK